MNCIDLRAIAGSRFRIGHDEAAEHEPGGRNDPWLMIIPGRYGHVYPHSATLLAVATKSRGPISRAITALSGVTVEQDGDDGINATFPPELFAKVARIVKLHRKAQKTPEQLAAAKERLSKFAFKPRRPGTTGHVPATQTA